MRLGALLLLAQACDVNLNTLAQTRRPGDLYDGGMRGEQREANIEEDGSYSLGIVELRRC
jgi:hypothetical protein